MAAQAGDRIVVESEKVGLPDRDGEILEVIPAPYGTRYRVRWTDGRESTIRPSAGSSRTIPKAEPPDASLTHARTPPGRPSGRNLEPGTREGR